MHTIDLLDEPDDEAPVSAWELALSAGLAPEDEDEDNLGLRTLYEHPEALLGRRPRLRAA